MIFQTILLCFSLILVHGQSDPKLQIVNGQNASPQEATFTVFVQQSYMKNGQLMSGRCAGALLDAQTVLTAAHCVNKAKKGDVKVIYGTKNMKNQPYEPIADKRVTVHFEYDGDNNDIAIVKLEKAVKLQLNGKLNGIEFAKLPRARQYRPGMQATAYGWGDTTVNNAHVLPDMLQKTTLRLMEEVTWNKNKTIIHARNENSALCSGDSGGPLVVDKNVLIGVHTATDDHPYIDTIPCKLGSVAVFNKVEYYLPWIKKNR